MINHGTFFLLGLANSNMKLSSIILLLTAFCLMATAKSESSSSSVQKDSEEMIFDVHGNPVPVCAGVKPSISYPSSFRCSPSFDTSFQKESDDNMDGVHGDGSKSASDYAASLHSKAELILKENKPGAATRALRILDQAAKAEPANPLNYVGQFKILSKESEYKEQAQEFIARAAGIDKSYLLVQADFLRKIGSCKEAVDAYQTHNKWTAAHKTTAAKWLNKMLFWYKGPSGDSGKERFLYKNALDCSETLEMGANATEKGDHVAAVTHFDEAFILMEYIPSDLVW